MDVKYSYYLKFGELWIWLWGRRFAKKEFYPKMMAEAKNGIHRVSYLVGHYAGN